MEKKFKLQKVLDYRNLMLEREKAKLAELAMQEQQMIEMIRQATALIRKKQEEMSASEAENDFNMTEMYQKYILKLEADRNRMQAKLAEHRQVMYKQKNATVKAYRGKSIMDKLSVRHKAAYSHFIDKEEAKTVEDIVLTRKAGNQGNE